MMSIYYSLYIIGFLLIALVQVDFHNHLPARFLESSLALGMSTLNTATRVIFLNINSNHGTDHISQRTSHPR